MSDPLVSVVIPTVDRAAYLRIALRSVVAQSYSALEIIVCDNASNEDLSDLVASFNDSRIRLYRQPVRVGQTKNIVSGVTMATGKYIAVLGDDDVWHPDFIGRLIVSMEADPNVIVSFCGHDIIDNMGRLNVAMTERVTRRFGRHLLKDGIYSPFDEIALVYRAICIVSGCLIRRDAIDWFRIPEELPLSIDLYIAYLLATAGGSSAYNSTHLMQFRYHTVRRNSFTNVQRSWRADLRCTLQLWMAFLHNNRMKSRSYIQMICVRKAILILIERLRQREWRGVFNDFNQFFRLGLLDPRAVYYHLFYFVRFQRQGVRRLLP